MKKLIHALLLCTLLSACSLVHKMDIEQGNVITPTMVSKLHKGMNPSQVKEIMGTPQLLNTFNNDRVVYVYTFKPGGKQMTEKLVELTFNHGVLINVRTEGLY